MCECSLSSREADELALQLVVELDSQADSCFIAWLGTRDVFHVHSRKNVPINAVVKVM